MGDELEAPPAEQMRGRPFPKGRSGNPAGRRVGSRNKATLAAQKLLAGEAEALTRRAVEAAFADDPTAMRLCLERILPRERAVEFALPPIKSAADIARAMGAVTAALAGGLITPGEAQAIARVFTTFVQTIETATSTNAYRCSKPARPKTGRASRGLGRFRAFQPEEEFPLQTRCGCSGLSCSRQP